MSRRSPTTNPSSGDEKYNLYYTFNKALKTTPLGPKQKSNLKVFLNNGDVNQKEAAIRLIVEHSKVADGYTYDPNNLELPYQLYEDETSVMLSLDNLPNELQWVLHKFALTAKKK